MHFLIVHANISIVHGYPQCGDSPRILQIHPRYAIMSMPPSSAHDYNVVPHLPTQRRLKAHDTAEEVPALTTKCVLDQVDPTVLVLVDKVSSSPDKSDMLVKVGEPP
ncbi:hypothetical protein KC354_g137 [Hortaea werneckii]|nr:hypothetical protein KC354_g137 [Hortaea werneckii]